MAGKAVRQPARLPAAQGNFLMTPVRDDTYVDIGIGVASVVVTTEGKHAQRTGAPSANGHGGTVACGVSHQWWRVA